MRSQRAFTLIELLIVVAIIAILAAIAVPNFLEAQTRAKVSRVKSDLRSLATAVESYVVDWNYYPLDSAAPQYRLEDVVELSTPIAYMTSIGIRDPFNQSGVGIMGSNLESFQYYSYAPSRVVADPNWGDVALSSMYPEFQTRTVALKSWGPDLDEGGIEWLILGRDVFRPTGDPNGHVGIDRIYDPTNGTISYGDIARFAGETHGIAQQP